jgi:hypothetical protein
LNLVQIALTIVRQHLLLSNSGHVPLLLEPGIVLALTLPFIYDKYEDVIDHHANRISEQAQAHYKKLDENVFSKIPKAPVKEKKIQ